MLSKSFQHSTTSIQLTSFAAEKCSRAIETWQIAGLDITLAAPRKFSFDSYHECRNINRSRNDSPTPPVCTLYVLCILYTPTGVAFDDRIFFWPFAG